MRKFVYKGSNPDSHGAIIMLGSKLGLQNLRKMSMGDKICELANLGNERAKNICSENPTFFESI